MFYKKLCFFKIEFIQKYDYEIHVYNMDTNVLYYIGQYL